MKKNTILFSMLALILCLSACGSLVERGNTAGIGQSTPPAEPTLEAEATPRPIPTVEPEEEPTPEESSTQEPTPDPIPTPTPEPTPDPTPASGIRPEFKATMDSYEAFFDEYAEFMQRYTDSDYSYEMMMDYMEFLNQYLEAMEALDALGEEDLTPEEDLYYAEVMLRISAKLLETADSYS